jgi:hypothetical protein
MPLAADYPFLDVFWSILVFFIWVAWFFLLFRVFADIFRRRDIGGGTKVLWIIFTLCVPFLGVFVYVISQNHHMVERDMEQAQARQQEFDAYVQSRAAAGGGGAAADIEKAKGLLDSGAITQAEFDALKAKALASA